MEHGIFGSKSLQGSKVGKARPQANQKSTKYYVDFELADHQLQAMKAKLPKGFFLLNPNNGDLQKFRNEYKANFLQKDSAGSKHNLIKAKKEQKKMESKERAAQLHHEKKPENKQSEKSMQTEKPKKEKKDAKAHGRKLFQLKSTLQPQQNMQEVIEQIQKQELTEKKPEEAFKKKPKQIKQKKHTKEFSQIQKQSVQPVIKMQVENIEKQPEKIIVKSQFNQPRQNEHSNDHLSIPCLANNAPRYDPRFYSNQVGGSSELNTLCYYFGLPYGGSISESAPRLNQKQKKFCNNIIQRLKNHRSSQAFRVPVDPQSQGVPDYYAIVYSPMDLRTIQKKINKDRYHFISQFHADINMIFLNSYKYNLRQTVYFEATVQFEDYYHQLLRQAKKNPEEFTKEYVTKFSKTRNDSGELDYTEHTPKKQKRKNESIRNVFNMTKSQILEKDRKSLKLLKNKSMCQDQSGMLSQSYVMETINEFNLDNLAADNNESKITRKQQKEIRPKIRKVESVQLPIVEIFNNTNVEKIQIEKMQIQIQQPQKPQQKQQKIEIPVKIEDERFDVEAEIEEMKKLVMADESSIQAEEKGHISKRSRNDDYNDDDHPLMENFECAFQVNSQNSFTHKGSMIYDNLNMPVNPEADKGSLEHSQPEVKIVNEAPIAAPFVPPAVPQMEVQKKITKVGRKSQKQHRQQSKPKKPKEQKIKQQPVTSPGKSTLQPNAQKQIPKIGAGEFPKFFNPPHQGHNESIIVHNINTHPQPYIANPFHGSVDILTENAEHPNSGSTTATVALMNANPAETKANVVSKSKKIKHKSKNVDEQYRCESDDDFVLGNRGHTRKNKEKKITKSKIHRESSNSGDNQAYAPQRKRGRQPKKTLLENSIGEEAGKSLEREAHPPAIPPSLQYGYGYPYGQEQLYHITNIDNLELPYIPEQIIPPHEALPFGNELEYQQNDLLDNDGSIFYQNSREDSNQQNQQHSKMV